MKGNSNGLNLLTIIGSYEDPVLIDKFCEYYSTRFDIKSVQLIVHSNVGKVDETVYTKFKKWFNCDIRYYRWHSSKYSGFSQSVLENTIRCDNSFKDDIFLVVDVDEFVNTTQEYIDWFKQSKYTHVRGIMVDRISSDFKLCPLSQNESIFQTFPVDTLFTGRNVLGNAHKVCLVKYSAILSPGHHAVLNENESLNIIGTENRMVVYHFKWTKNLLETFDKRLSSVDYTLGGAAGAYKFEVNRLFNRLIDRSTGTVKVTEDAIVDLTTNVVSIKERVWEDITALKEHPRYLEIIDEGIYDERGKPVLTLEGTFNLIDVTKYQ